MSDPSIVQVEGLIEELYSSNDTLLAKQIQEQLQSLQKQPYAWEIASQLLASQSKQCQFFGAHTFQVKITSHWETLPEDKVEWLKNELLGWIVRLCGGPAFVTTKLCVALIAFAFHTASGQWPHFIPATLEALQLSSHTYGVPTDVVNSVILEFLTLVPEEVSNSNIAGGRRLQLIGQVKESIPLVLSTILSNLRNRTSTEIQQKTLRCLQSWVQYGFSLEEGYAILQEVMSLLGDPDLFEPAVDVLLESMQQSSWAKYHNYRNDLLTCFTSKAMKEKFESCMAEEDEDTARVIAKLLTAFGETYTDYIAVQLARPDIYWIMTMIIRLSDFKGFFPVDQEVTEIPLNFWYNLQETLFDECILPVKQLPPADQENSTEQQWKFTCGQAALAIYRDLVEIWAQGARFPDELTWVSWNKDIRDKFKIWRRDLGDTMINPYYVLREEMLDILLNHTVRIINQWTSLTNPSQSLEGTLFCLKSISEEITADENLHVARFFGPEILGRLPIDCGSRLKGTVLILMGSFAEWLKTHPQYLGSVMNYIVPCLSDPQLAPAASCAFADICDTCRELLVDELAGLMRVYAAMTSSNIRPNIMQKVVEAVANAIQVLPPDKAMGPLMSLTGDILQGISKAIANTEKDPQGSRDTVLVQLQYLSACCRGIQSPNDDYQSLGVRNSVYDAFASGQLLAMYAHIDGFSQVTYAIRESSSQIARVWGTDELIAKALSTFLEQGIRSTSPLLSLDFIDLAALVESSYVAAPFACWLDAASFMMTVYGGQQMYIERLRDLLGVITTKTLGFIHGAEGNYDGDVSTV
ncbi:armadillo-type protein [Parasitella parasitica]|nr:armadillo-type protein [Parasitella parasitica]